MPIRKEQLPWVMSGGRAMLGPVLVVGEKCGWSGAGLAALVVTALMSDVFDGVLARRWKCDTAGVRLFDSMADAVFYMCAGVALWIGQPQIWRDNAGLLEGVLGLEAIRYAVEFWKFGKPASYHSYLAKAWGVVLATGIVGAFAMHRNNAVLVAALALGIISNLEGLAMSLVLPVWHKDLKTLKAALAVREQVRSSKFEVRGKSGTLVSKAAALVVIVAMAMPAFAANPAMEATYSGGTAKIAADTPGTLDTTSPTELVFRAKTDGEVAIPYVKIRSYEPRHDVVRHLGFLPAVVAGLVAARQRTYTVAISYADDSGGMQVVVVRTTERDHRELQMILRARAAGACIVKEYMPGCGVRPPTPAAAKPVSKVEPDNTPAPLCQARGGRYSGSLGRCTMTTGSDGDGHAVLVSTGLREDGSDQGNGGERTHQQQGAGRAFASLAGNLVGDRQSNANAEGNTCTSQQREFRDGQGT